MYHMSESDQTQKIKFNLFVLNSKVSILYKRVNIDLANAMNCLQ